MQFISKLSETVTEINKNSESKAVFKKVMKLGIIGGAMTGGGGLVIVLFPIILNAIIEWQLVIKDGNIFTQNWSDVPLPVTVNIYIWNLDNPDQFRNGAKPRMREMGPYSYLVSARHQIVSWGVNDESVKYYLYASLKFDASNSVGHYSDKLTLLNPATYVAAGTARNIIDKIPFAFTVGPIVYAFMNAFFLAHGEGLILETTAGDLLNGKYLSMIGTIDTLIKPIKWLGIDKLIPLLGEQLELMEIHARDNKFGLIHAINNSRLGPYEMWTGRNDHKKFNTFKSWKGRTVLNHWNEPQCNEFRGVEGVNFGTYLNKKDKLYIFVPDLGRSLYATYKKFSFAKAIPSWRYELRTLFQSPDKTPENKCYCSTPKDYAMCDGIFDLGPCQFLVPIAISFPHLLFASDKIQSGVEGLNPNLEKHEAYLDVNPSIGSPIGGRLRIQANILIKPVPLMFGYSGLPEAVYPLIWLDVVGEAPGILEWLLRFGMYGLYLGEYLPFLAFFGGLGILGYTSHLVYKEKETLFKPKRDSTFTPMEPFDQIERQMASKAQRSYPTLFDTSGDENIIRPNHAQRSFNRRVSTPLSGMTVSPNRLEIVMTPPGAVD